MVQEGWCQECGFRVPGLVDEITTTPTPTPDSEEQTLVLVHCQLPYFPVLQASKDPVISPPWSWHYLCKSLQLGHFLSFAQLCHDTGLGGKELTYIGSKTGREVGGSVSGNKASDCWSCLDFNIWEAILRSLCCWGLRRELRGEGGKSCFGWLWNRPCS